MKKTSFERNDLKLFAILCIGVCLNFLSTFSNPLPSNQSSSAIIENQIEVCFTPPKGCVNYIIDAIDNAQETIFVETYSFTSKAITESLIRAKRRGVNIHVLADRTAVNGKGSRIKELKDNGIEVEICNVPGIAHNKVIVIDEEIVITGSYNFTQAAETRNAENLLIIKNTELAYRYLDNWYKLKDR